jgi:hypothetical protein
VRVREIIAGRQRGPQELVPHVVVAGRSLELLPRMLALCDKALVSVLVSIPHYEYAPALRAFFLHIYLHVIGLTYILGRCTKSL